MPRIEQLAEAIFDVSKRSWVRATRDTSELTESEFLALDHLSGVGTATVGDTQQHIKVVPAQMSRLLRRLEGSGFVTSDINREDRRRVDITVTDTGRAVHARYRKAKLGPIVAALERLTEDERSQFMTLVEKMSGRHNSDGEPHPTD